MQGCTAGEPCDSLSHALGEGTEDVQVKTNHAAKRSRRNIAVLHQQRPLIDAQRHEVAAIGRRRRGHQDLPELSPLLDDVI